jgi:hypothetical protein
VIVVIGNAFLKVIGNGFQLLLLPMCKAKATPETTTVEKPLLKAKTTILLHKATFSAVVINQKCCSDHTHHNVEL